MQERIDIGCRVGGEKAQEPDEFITRSQIVDLNGNPYSMNSNHDIVIPSINTQGGFQFYTREHVYTADELKNCYTTPLYVFNDLYSDLASCDTAFVISLWFKNVPGNQNYNFTGNGLYYFNGNGQIAIYAAEFNILTVGMCSFGGGVMGWNKEYLFDSYFRCQDVATTGNGQIAFSAITAFYFSTI